MTSATSQLDGLLSPARLYRQYRLSEYLAYCADIRSAIMQLPREFDDQRVISFFEKEFVEEMEVLAKICRRHFGTAEEGVVVEYMQNDPPDGVITLANGDQIFVECTSARDSRWEKFALEQGREHGVPVSLSGFKGSDIAGSRHRGYAVRGMSVDDPEVQPYLVEADEDCEVIERHREQIADKIQRKLGKVWQPRTNWLCVFVNEYVMASGSYARMEPTLNSIVDQYRSELAAQHIAGVWFVSNRCDDAAWISYHPT